MKENFLTNKQILLVFIYLSPLLFFGYTADDRQHVLQHILMSERGIWNNIELIVNDVVNMQRFFPLHIILYSTAFKIFDYSNAWIYHALQILLNIMAFRSFARWIKSYFDVKIDSVFLLILLTTIQFRVTYSDPIVSYFGLMQILTIAQFEGMICLKRYIAEGNKFNRIKWIIILMTQLFLYELTIFLMPITVFYLYVNRRLNYDRYLSACLSGVMLVVIYLITYIYFKIQNELNYSGTSISLSIEKIINTTIIEGLGSLPLTYAGYIASQKLGMNGVLIWGIYIIIMVILAMIILKEGKLNKANLADLQLLKYGALIWACSAFSISLSERYQKELSLGLTYMVSYMQNFGYVMVVYYLASQYKAKKILVGLCVLTFIFNVIVLNEGNKIDGAKRIAMEVLTDNNINEKFNYTTLILNEKIMQEENEFKKNIGNKIKEIVYIKVNELDVKSKEIKNDNIGIGIVQTERYSRASLIVGRYDLAENKIYEAIIFTKNRKNAEEGSAKYKGIIQIIKNRENSNIFMVSISDPVKIDGEIKGNFR